MKQLIHHGVSFEMLDMRYHQLMRLGVLAPVPDTTTAFVLTEPNSDVVTEELWDELFTALLFLSEEDLYEAVTGAVNG